MKKTLVMLLSFSLVFIISGCNQAKQAEKKEVKTVNSNSVEEIKKELAKNVLTIKEADYMDETLNYIIDVKYPEIKYSDPSFEKYGNAINEKISAHIKDKIDYFISEVENWESTPEDIEMTMKSGLYTSYEAAAVNPKLISIKFSNSIYHAGAAHPETYSTVLNYDVENDKELIIEDIFKTNLGWEKALSGYVVPKLNEKIKTEFEFDDEKWVIEGAGPEADNFTVFTLSSEGMEFTWDPYIIAPYAAGPQTLIVPYSEISEYLAIDTAKYL